MKTYKVQTRTIAIFLTILSTSLTSYVYASKAYAQNHPLDGMHLKMMYCIDIQREQNRSPEDVGCKVGHGNGKVGVKQDIVKKLVYRINIYKDSYEYVQLVSKEGLHMVFKDGSVGSRGDVTVWQDTDGELTIKMGREE